jgi:uncharacterized membrane protein YcaP (DUF421 family)
MEAVLMIILRPAIIYLVIIFGIRIFGKKELSQLSVIDLVFILLISNAVQNAMVGENLTLWGGIVAALTLFVVNYAFKNIFLKSKKISELIQGSPLMLVYHGKVLQKHLKESRLSHDELEAAIREHGVENIEDVDLAVLEVDGNISVLSDQFRKVTTRHRHAHKVIGKNE